MWAPALGSYRRPVDYTFALAHSRPMENPRLWGKGVEADGGTPGPGDPPLDVRGFHEGILTYHTMTHRYKEENER